MTQFSLTISFSGKGRREDVIKQCISNWTPSPTRLFRLGQVHRDSDLPEEKKKRV